MTIDDFFSMFIIGIFIFLGIFFYVYETHFIIKEEKICVIEDVLVVPTYADEYKCENGDKQFSDSGLKKGDKFKYTIRYRK